MEDNYLTLDPLFKGLTQPNLILGVSLNYAVLNILVSAIYFINSANIYVVPLAIITHMIGYVLCFYEPRFIEIYLIKFQKCSKCKNRYYYGANSYFM